MSGRSCLSFKATSRQSQTLTFKCDSVTHEFNVGQMPKRSDTYLERHFLKWERCVNVSCRRAGAGPAAALADSARWGKNPRL